jgi:hypothetical protein
MPVAFAILLIAAAVFTWVAVRFVGAWLRYRGSRVITCPENLKPAGVQVDATRAALSGVAAAPNLRLRSCSRWPEKAGCGQDCLQQIKSAPADCLVRNILMRWYDAKNCVCCGQPIGVVHLLNQRPGLLTIDNKSLDWSEIAPENLQATLISCRPVCCSCHTATHFAQQHPGLVVDRSRPA